MTVKELSEAVKRLCGEYDYFDTEAFVCSANTALGVIFSECDFLGTASVYLSSPRVLTYTSRLRHRAKSTEELPLSGVAYSMRLFGKGTVEITDGENTVSQGFSGWGTVLRGFISFGGTLKFSGDTAYTVKDIACFAECEGTELSDIPTLGDKRSVGIRNYIPDFSRALSYPADRSGAPLSDIIIEGESIICPKNFSGEIYFSYKRRAPKISADVPEYEIPVSPEAGSALIMLCAAYLLGESESDAADFFLREYKRTVGHISSDALPSVSTAYFDTTGWA